MTRVSRKSTYIMTAVSAALFVLLCWIFADGLFSLDPDVLFRQIESDGITVVSEGTIWTYVLLGLIVVAGIYQARRIPAEGIEVAPTRSEERRVGKECRQR